MHHKGSSSNIMHSIMTIDQSPDVTMESDQNNNNENSSNNNLSIKKNEKYSLRQRGQRKSITNKHSKSAAAAGQVANERNSRSSSSVDINQNNANNLCDELNSAALSAAVKKSLAKGAEKTPKEKPKQKAAPLSKYRRKTANARERTRMREINHAFENLRQSVPVVVAGSPAQNTNEKLTKITTLRMAMKYIKILSDILDNKAVLNDSLLASLMEVDSKQLRKDKMGSYDESGNSSSSSSSVSSPINISSKSSKEKQQQQMPNVLAQNHHDYCKEFIRESLHVKPVKSSRVVATASSRKAVKANATKAKKPPSKSHSKSQKISGNSGGNLKSKQVTAASNPSLMSMRSQSIGIHGNIINSTNSINSVGSGSSESKFINHLLGGNFNHASSTTMLNGSGINNNNLNCLSKYDLSPCLTPPNDEPSELGLILESDGESLQLSEPCFSPLEFGLLLESDGESLHLSEPCLSPLSHLDAFNSINDLLHGSFNEHNSLEMYLS